MLCCRCLEGGVVIVGDAGQYDLIVWVYEIDR